MFFNITRYKEELNKSLHKDKGISQNTADLYLYCLTSLNDVLNEGATSSDIADAIVFRGGKSAEVFVAAVSFYERKVLGQYAVLLLPKDRSGIRVNQRVAELEHKPRFYRDRIRNSIHRLPLTLQERSGLRVAEVAALTRNDIMIVDDEILLNVRHGKGNKQRFVHVLPSNYLLKELPNFTEMPTAAALSSETQRLGFATHDLRKVNARTRYWIERANGKKKREALKEVQAELGHAKSAETIGYLGVEYHKRKNDWGY